MIGITTIYTLFGGMRAVIGMDFIQAVLIITCLTVVAVWAYATFGVGDVYQGLRENNPQALNLLLPAGLLFAWNTGLFSMGGDLPLEHLVAAGLRLHAARKLSFFPAQRRDVALGARGDGFP